LALLLPLLLPMVVLKLWYRRDRPMRHRGVYLKVAWRQPLRELVVMLLVTVRVVLSWRCRRGLPQHMLLFVQQQLLLLLLLRLLLLLLLLKVWLLKLKLLPLLLLLLLLQLLLLLLLLCLLLQLLHLVLSLRHHVASLDNLEARFLEKVARVLAQL
jgi:hypothetical protein